MRGTRSGRLLHGALVAACVASATPSAAQSLGPFTWQLQPYCNVIVVTATQVGPTYRLDGYDDQCGASKRAPLTGTATNNPDGTMAFAFSVITGNGTGTHASGVLNPASLTGSWVDNGGLTGTLAFGMPSPAPGAPRPVPQQPAVVGAVTRTDSIQVTGAQGERTILSLPFTIPPGRNADIVAFFNGRLTHASTTAVGSCFGLMRLDDESSGATLAPTGNSVLLLDGGVQVAGGAVHVVTASVQAVGANIGPGAHVLHMRAEAGGQGCFYGERSLVALATFR